MGLVRDCSQHPMHRPCRMFFRRSPSRAASAGVSCCRATLQRTVRRFAQRSSRHLKISASAQQRRRLRRLGALSQSRAQFEFRSSFKTTPPSPSFKRQRNLSMPSMASIRQRTRTPTTCAYRQRMTLSPRAPGLVSSSACRLDKRCRTSRATLFTIPKAPALRGLKVEHLSPARSARTGAQSVWWIQRPIRSSPMLAFDS